MKLSLVAWAGVAALVLSACGGGQEAPGATPDAVRLGAALSRAGRASTPTVQRLSVAPPSALAVDPLDAANQLMDFAERSFAGYFPSHPANGLYEGYLYRYYPETGIYLAVKDGNVYVLGGSFGNDIVLVGPLTQYITPVARPAARPLPCSTAGTNYGTWSTPAPAVGRNAAATLAGCTGEIFTVRWVQTSGPKVSLLTDQAQTISFEPTSAGSYGFEVRFTDPKGTMRSEAVVLDVPADVPPATSVALRGSQSVRMGGAVSVRAWPTLADGDSVASVEWTQLDGPTVKLDTTDDRVALFTAPTVSRDTVIRLRATLRTTQGRVATDEALVLVERHLQATGSTALWTDQHVQRVHAYKPASRYAADLVRCTYDTRQNDTSGLAPLCTLSQLPFLAQSAIGGLPTVEQVMDRVVVSHDWLGRNFETFLRTQDTRGDFRRMLSSVTAVVLGTQVRPSFYYAGTGAIYLDADTFWMTPEERDTINEAPDYRSEFGSDLKYVDLWRYVKDNQAIFAYFDPRQRITRTTDDVRNETAWVMYHELGHALDFLPPADYTGLNLRATAWSNLYGRYSQMALTSDTVSATYPLTSVAMQDLAQVQFHGAKATAEQRGYTPDDVASFFVTDLATDSYSYSTTHEDVAMTLEEFLMSHRLGVRRDVAFGDPYNSQATSSSITVRWGQRGRIGEPALHPRTRAIVQALVPWVDVNEVDRLPAPMAMRPGQSWRDNLSLPAIPRLAKPLSAAEQVLQRWQSQRELARMQKRAQRPGPRLPAPPVALGNEVKRRCGGAAAGRRPVPCPAG
jgi:hypothetical protein